MNALGKHDSFHIFGRFHLFPFGFEDWMWNLIVLVPDHCLYFYFSINSKSNTETHVQKKSHSKRHRGYLTFSL